MLHLLKITNMQTNRKQSDLDKDYTNYLAPFDELYQIMYLCYSLARTLVYRTLLTITCSPPNPLISSPHPPAPSSKRAIQVMKWQKTDFLGWKKDMSRYTLYSWSNHKLYILNTWLFGRVEERKKEYFCFIFLCTHIA